MKMLAYVLKTQVNELNIIIFLVEISALNLILFEFVIDRVYKI